MFRVALSLKNGKMVSDNFDTRDKADEYVLTMAELHGISIGWIKDMANNKRERIEDL